MGIQQPMQWAALIVVSLGRFALGLPNEPPAASTHETAVPVLIEYLPIGSSELGVMSGWYLDQEGTVVTARHACELARSVWVNAGSVGCMSVKEVLVDRPDIDLLVFRTDVPPKTVTAVGLSELTPSKGDQCTVLSVNRDGKCSIEHRTFRKQEAMFEECRRSISGTMRPGQSGSPVVGEDGKVIGMAIRARTSAPSDGIEAESRLVGSPAIQDALDDAKRAAPIPIQEWLSRFAEPQARSCAEKLALGKQAVREERLEDAIKHLYEANAISPGNPLPIVEIQSTLGALGRLEDLTRVLDKAYAASPNERVFRLWGGELYFQRGFPLMAENEFRAAHKMRATVASATSLGYVLGYQKKFAEAKAVLSEAIQSHPKHAGPVEMQAWIATESDDKELAIAMASRLCELCPTSEGALYSRGMAEARAGHKSEYSQTERTLAGKNAFLANRLAKMVSLMEPKKAE